MGEIRRYVEQPLGVRRRIKPLDQFTEEDWTEAAFHLNKSAYEGLRRRAVRLGLQEAGNARIIQLDSVGKVQAWYRAVDTQRMEAYNKELEKWSRITAGSIRSRLIQLGLGGGELFKSLEPTFSKNEYGEINGLGYRFARHGVFIHKGAYRGYGGLVGSKWSLRKKTPFGSFYTGEIRSTNRKSKGKLHRSNMKEMDWFDSVITRRMAKLSDICASYSSDILVDATKIYIKGGTKNGK